MHKIYSLAWRARLDLVYVNLFFLSFFSLSTSLFYRNAFKMPNFPFDESLFTATTFTAPPDRQEKLLLFSLARDVGEKWPRPGPQASLFSSRSLLSPHDKTVTKTNTIQRASSWGLLRGKTIKRTAQLDKLHNENKDKTLFVRPDLSRLSERWTINTGKKQPSKNVIIDSRS